MCSGLWHANMLHYISLPGLLSGKSLAHNDPQMAISEDLESEEHGDTESVHFNTRVAPQSASHRPTPTRHFHGMSAITVESGVKKKKKKICPCPFGNSMI